MCANVSINNKIVNHRVYYVVIEIILLRFRGGRSIKLKLILTILKCRIVSLTHYSFQIVWNKISSHFIPMKTRWPSCSKTNDFIIAFFQYCTVISQLSFIYSRLVLSVFNMLNEELCDDQNFLYVLHPLENVQLIPSIYKTYHEP